MTDSRSLAPMTALALMMGLSACGGGGSGGVASTPTPAPTPTPTPSPTPSPSASPINSNIRTPTANENFTNDAVTGGWGFTATATSLVVAYERATNSYTIIAGDRQNRFTPADARASSGNEPFITAAVFTQSDPSAPADTGKFERLDLTQGYNGPDHDYQYVAGATWMSRRAGVTRYDATAFGVETPDAALPRIGSASFTARLFGKGSWSGNVYTHLEGAGSLAVNFATGALTGSGLAREYGLTLGAPGVPAIELVAGGDWRVSAQLNAGSNAFAGTLDLYPSASPGLSASLNGRFYGPTGQEIGGAFALNGTSRLGTGSLTGVLMGGQPDPARRNYSLAAQTVDATYLSAGSGSLVVDVDAATGLAHADYKDPAKVPSSFAAIAYRKADNAFVLQTLATGLTPVLDTASATAKPGDGRFAAWEQKDAAATTELRLYRPAGSNSEIALTYASFAHVRRVSPGSAAGRASIENQYLAFGLASNPTAIPISGTATYRGILHGQIIDGREGSPIRTVEGTSLFQFDFGAGTVGGNLHPQILTEGGGRLDLGEWAFATSRIMTQTGGPPVFEATFTSGGFSRGGNLRGGFFGPAASELAGTFQAGVNPLPNPAPGAAGEMAGAFVATKR